jgi:hypothetical protein
MGGTQSAVDARAARASARELREQAATVRSESRRLQRLALRHYRARLSGGADVVARAILDAVDGGALCAQCIATRRALPLFIVEIVLAELRRCFRLDCHEPCAGCGTVATIFLNAMEHGTS